MSDNSNLAAKLDLRRHFLARYHSAGRLDVFDGFQASGVIWATLRAEFKTTSYWGVDILGKKGRLKIDSARILGKAGWHHNVVDLDAYGSPWKHWFNLLLTADHAVTVFLTVRSFVGFRNRLSILEQQCLGIPFDLPKSIASHLGVLAVNRMLAQASERFTIAEALEAFPSLNMRYFGLRLEPKIPPPYPPKRPGKAAHIES